MKKLFFILFIILFCSFIMNGQKYYPGKIVMWEDRGAMPPEDSIIINNNVYLAIEKDSLYIVNDAIGETVSISIKQKMFYLGVEERVCKAGQDQLKVLMIEADRDGYDFICSKEETDDSRMFVVFLYKEDKLFKALVMGSYRVFVFTDFKQ